MVRLKNRYLLLEILYPTPTSWPKSTSTAAKNQSHLRLHSPTSNKLTPGLLAKMIRDEVAAIYGDWGVGKLGGSGVSVKYLSPATSTAIIRCPRACYRLVWTALTYLTRVPDFVGEFRYPLSEAGGSGRERECVVRVVRVSGTMRKAEEEAVWRARGEVVRLRAREEVGVLEGLVGGADGGCEGGRMEEMEEVDEEEMDDGDGDD